ncbi:MAG TPA: M57 family metalloprotease [Chitinophaga sp.]|uniref:M57 family metalloprotease n=1 Tax=Chitinophaga sp. TaxID=1869181 RepID=UPI002CDBC8F1|nr:M57 family metalloprotease [Chitinophaga sp.]HVI48082.1 M57 family metalloprotease [Chitinophaga sp.]
MKKHIKILAFLALATFTITSCSKSNDEAKAPAQDNAQKVLAYIENLGFPKGSIREEKDEFIVEEDIIFSKNMQVPADLGKGAKTEQYYTGSTVSVANSKNIRLRIDASMTSMTAEINSAINQWNTVPNCTIKWVIAPAGGAYDVTIQDYNLGSGVCGQGTFPSGGVAGNLIRINKAYIAGNSFAQRQRTITHEMGHNVSFRHTNWASIGEPSATQVPGTGTSDASSIMNGGQCGSGATVLSARDKQAAAVLYPL